MIARSVQTRMHMLVSAQEVLTTHLTGKKSITCPVKFTTHGLIKTMMIIDIGFVVMDQIDQVINKEKKRTQSQA